MKKISLPFIWLVAFVCGFAPAIGQTQSYHFNDNFKILIQGTSNVHDWVSSVNKVEGGAEVVVGEDGSIQIEKTKLQIPVKSIISPKGSIMDGKTWDALNADQHPTIEFNLTRFTPKAGQGGLQSFDVDGTLQINGEKQSIKMEVTGKILPDGSIDIMGKKSLKMTSYNVTPPTAFFGAMTTGDEVVIDFHVALLRNP